MVQRLIMCVFLVGVVLQTNAQNFPSEQWYVGGVTLNDNSMRRGQVKYDLERDLVQVKIDGRTETYSPQQVVSFQLQVGITSKGREAKKPEFIHRVFFSLPYANSAGYKRLSFFEVVVEGKATLLAREYIATVSANNAQRVNRWSGRTGSWNRQPQNLSRNILAHKMYLGSLDGKITELPSKRKDLLRLLGDHQAMLKDFVKEENLKLDRLYDVAKLFDYYNSLNNKQSRAH